VRGDPEHPVNQGKTCVRGRMMLEHLYHPERVNNPLRRVGERGSGEWERVSWDVALDDIAARLDGLRQRYGAETLAVGRGTYRTYHWDARRFLNLFGSPNIFGPNFVCHCPSVAVESAVYGALPHPDLGQAACIVNWGACRSVSAHVTDWPALVAAKKRGARLITVDPRRTAEAEMSDLWLQIRPGTDVALMLSWINVIGEEGLYDDAFVDDWTIGFQEVHELARQFPPQRASRLTWIPEERIVSAARMYATTRPAVIKSGQGVEKAGPDFRHAAHARAVLRAITGNLDVRGGERFGGAQETSQVISHLDMELNEALPPGQRSKLLGGDDYRLFSYDSWERVAKHMTRFPESYLRPTETSEVVCAHPNAVFTAAHTDEPYPVRAIICQAANPLITLADPARTVEALRALDLLVVMDYYVTPTGAVADYILPAASTVERDDLVVYGSGCIACPRALDPIEERRSDFEFWMELGRRLGQASHWPWDTAEEVCNYRLAPMGMDFDRLKNIRSLFEDPPVGRTRELGFPTASGKVELRSSMLEELGYDPLPGYSPVDGDENDEFPLTLITGNGFEPMYNSEQRQWPSARRRCPFPLVSIHPDTAAEFGVSEGDWVRVETPRGAVRQRARLTTSIHPRMADVQHGWWFPERECSAEDLFGFLESNANALCRDDRENCSPETGSWKLAGLQCRIVPEKPTTIVE
jgi:anaerobic selenocysteine-containing dehydrogenase